jgi:hypothetical protein
MVLACVSLEGTRLSGFEMPLWRLFSEILMLSLCGNTGLRREAALDG